MVLTLQPKGSMGAGDLLMSFLGVVILSFGFRIYGQRRLMKRHAPEIFGATTLSAAFSLFSTACAAKALGLAPGNCPGPQPHLAQGCPELPYLPSVRIGRASQNSMLNRLSGMM